MEATEAKLRQLIANLTGLAHDVDGTRNLYFDLGVSSVHALTLLSELESEFGVAIPDDEYVSATTIESLTTLMNDLVAQAGKSTPPNA